jgi:hypothetical protein
MVKAMGQEVNHKGAVNFTANPLFKISRLKEERKGTRRHLDGRGQMKYLTVMFFR